MLALRSARRLWLAGLFLAAAVAARPVVAESPAEAEAQQKQVEQLEKQLADLQKQLADLKAKDAAPPGKKALAIADADTWRAVRGAALSPDGKWFAHRVGPTEGNGEVLVRPVAGGKELKFPAGPGGQGFPGLRTLEFSAGSKWLAFTVAPGRGRPVLSALASAVAGTTAPRPQPKVVLVNLASGEKTEFDGMASFQFSGESATHLAMRKASAGSAEQTPAPQALPPGLPAVPGLTTRPAPDAPAHTGRDLVLRDLAAGTDLVLGNVSEFEFDKKGTWLAMLIDAQGQAGNGVHLRDMGTGAVYPVESAKATYAGLNWNAEGTAFAVRKGVAETGGDGKWYSAVGFTAVGPKPTKHAYDPKADKAFPAGMGISPNRPVTWTDDLGGFVFGIAERKKADAPATPPAGGRGSARRGETPGTTPAPTTTPTTPSSASARPDMVIWHWKDTRLQPMQEKQAAADRLYSYLCVYRLKDKKFVRLADDTARLVTLAPKQKYAVGGDVKPYQLTANLDGRQYVDVYVTDAVTGERRKAFTKARNYGFGPVPVVPSPTGTHFLHYADGHYHVYDMATGQSVNITEKVSGTTFVNTEDDHNVDKPPTRPVGWTADGKHVLLSDNWDVWKVAADGTGGSNLTVNGKADGVRYQGFSQFDPDLKGIDLSKPAYTSLYGEWTKKDGIGRVDLGKPGVTVLLWADAKYGPPQKAKKADVFAFTRETSRECPDVYVTDATFTNPQKMTDANPQQKEYKWSSGVKLLDYKGTEGKRLQAALFLPADYEPGKKYPTVVYIYEKLSDRLHGYTAPGTGGGFNTAIYTSNGYAVLMPDLTYRVNDPGLSSMECLLPALDAAVASGVVDNTKVGLQGHSWGGYQTAFAVTQTARFKAAVAGAPLTDLVSMYSSVYWNTGSANQPIFESSQGRFKGGYWDHQDAYLRNSPVYFAKNVQTPLVLLHNDKDGAVDFTQGVEYFNTLRRLQKPVVMLQYKGENHGLVKPENRKDYAVRMREFFDHHLQGKPAPDWWTEGVPHLKLDEHLKGRSK